MITLAKAALSLAVILAATGIARRFPSLAGLIGVMPLTGALVLVWVYLENAGDRQIMQSFTRGAMWGILPSALFFITAFVCMRKQMPFALVFCSSFGVWLAGACLHQWLVK